MQFQGPLSFALWSLAPGLVYQAGWQVDWKLLCWNPGGAVNGQEEGTHYRARSSHTALNPGFRIEMHWWKDIPMDTEEHKSFHGWQHQASKTLPARDRNFHPMDSQHVHIPGTAVGSGVAPWARLGSGLKRLVVWFILLGPACILSHQMTLMEKGWELTSWIKECIFIVCYKNPCIWPSGTVRIDKSRVIVRLSLE